MTPQARCVDRRYLSHRVGPPPARPSKARGNRVMLRRRHRGSIVQMVGSVDVNTTQLACDAGGRFFRATTRAVQNGRCSGAGKSAADRVRLRTTGG